MFKVCANTTDWGATMSTRYSQLLETALNCMRKHEKKKYHWPFQTPAADAWSHGGKWRLCSCPSFLWASIHSSWCKQCTKPVLRYHICLQDWSKAVKNVSGTDIFRRPIWISRFLVSARSLLTLLEFCFFCISSSDICL